MISFHTKSWSSTTKAAMMAVLLVGSTSAFQGTLKNGGKESFASQAMFQNQKMASGAPSIPAMATALSAPKASTALHMKKDEEKNKISGKDKNILWRTWDGVFSSPIIPPLLFFGPIVGTLYKNLGVDASFFTENPVLVSSLLAALISAFGLRYQLAKVDDVVFEKRLALRALKNARAKQFSDTEASTGVEGSSSAQREMNAAKSRYETALRDEVDQRRLLFVFAGLAEKRQEDIEADQYAVKTFLNMKLTEDGELVSL